MIAETPVEAAITIPWGGRTPMKWYRLMHEAEQLRARTRWGLMNVWEHIQSGDYDAARECLDDMQDYLGDLCRDGYVRPSMQTAPTEKD